MASIRNLINEHIEAWLALVAIGYIIALILTRSYILHPIGRLTTKKKGMES